MSVVYCDWRQLLRDELDVNPDPNPAAAADTVAKMIPDDALRDVVAELLRLQSQQVAARERHEIRSAVTRNKWAGPNGVSAVCARLMQERVDIAGVRKFRADCTQADVATIRDARIAAANALMTEGRREDLLLKKMKRLRAATVGDLPQSSIVEVLSWQP